MPGRLAFQLYRLIWEALDWIYPPTCGGCGRPGIRWCSACNQQTSEIAQPFCPICGNSNTDDKPCSRCRDIRPLYTYLRSHTVFAGPIREAIHHLKYDSDMSLGEALATPMIDSLQKLNWSLDLVTPVPLGLVRLKERGYNQADLLARPIALCLCMPFRPRALQRKRETRSQVGLSVDERRSNMVDAFQADNNIVGGKNILVVDDVATSGATLNACARALLDAGAAKVYCFTLARAVYSPEMQGIA
jgi:competence protein ComFC